MSEVQQICYECKIKKLQLMNVSQRFGAQVGYVGKCAVCNKQAELFGYQLLDSERW